MKLHRLTCYNFMPYKGRHILDFPLDDQRNVMIIFGDNMRGKTSILNAIRWGFYGKALGRHSRSINLQDLVNRDASLEDDWRVEVFLTFEANGRLYDLRRSAAKRAHVAVPSRPEDFTITVHLTRDSEQISGSQIESEINQIAPEQVSRFFLFDGELLEEYESLLFEGSEQGRQIKEAIEQVLGVPALINGRAEIGAILKSATKRQNSEISHIQGLEKAAARQQELSARQDALDRDLDDLQVRLTRIKSERNKLEDELDAAAIVLASKAKLDSLTILKKNLEETRDRKRIERHGVLADAWRDVLEARLKPKKDGLLNRQSELTRGIREQGKIQSRIEDLRKLLSSNRCPTCGQDLGRERRSEIGGSLGALEAESAHLRDETVELQHVSAQLAALNKIRGVNAKDRLQSIDREARSAEVDLQRVENDIERIQDEIAQEDTAELSRKRVLQIEALKEEGRLTQNIASVRREIDKTKEELAIAQKAIEGLAPERSRKSTLKVKIASELEKTFAASIEDLRDSLREKVGQLADRAFKQMTTQQGYRGLEINSNYGLSILDGAGRKVPLRSAGAEQVVALSLIDGLNRTGRAVGPVVMDTPFGRLDLQHRDNILSYLPTVTSQFVLLVHSGEIRPQTDLTSIRSRIGATYKIAEETPTRSKLEKVEI